MLMVVVPTITQVGFFGPYVFGGSNEYAVAFNMQNSMSAVEFYISNFAFFMSLVVSLKSNCERHQF